MSTTPQLLMIALGLVLDRLEGASHDRPPSEDRDHLIAEDNEAISFGRKVIDYYHKQGEEA